MGTTSRHKKPYWKLVLRFFPCIRVRLERSKSPCPIPRPLLICSSPQSYLRALFRDKGKFLLFSRIQENLSCCPVLSATAPPCCDFLGEVFSGYNLGIKEHSLHWGAPIILSLVSAQPQGEAQRLGSFQPPTGRGSLISPRPLCFSSSTCLLNSSLLLGEKLALNIIIHSFLCYGWDRLLGHKVFVVSMATYYLRDYEQVWGFLCLILWCPVPHL